MAIAYTAAPSVIGCVAVHGDLAPPAGVARPAEHADTVEVHDDVAGAVERDDPAFSAGAAQLHLNHLVHRLRQRHATVVHLRAHIVGDHLADEVLTLAGAGHRAGLVACISAGADERGVPDAPAVLVGEAPGGSGRCEVAGAIERHGADGSHALSAQRRHGLRGRCADRTRLFGATRLFELVLARLGAEIAARHEHHALFQRKILGTLGNQQHVRALLHHETCQFDGVFHVPYAGHRSGAWTGAVHDGRVELGVTVVVEHRTPPGVELRIVLHQPHGCGNCVEARATALEDVIA